MRLTNAERKIRNEEIVSAIQRGCTTKSVADFYSIRLDQVRFIVRQITGAGLDKLRGSAEHGDITYIGPNTVYEKPLEAIPYRKPFERDVIVEKPFDGTFTESELRMIERQKQAAEQKNVQ